MTRRRMRGYSLMEVVVAMAVFGIFLFIVTILMLEMSKQEKRFPVNFMQNPQVIGVLGRLRRDVQDAYKDDPYLGSLEGYTQGPKTLIIST
ncbi:MAG TPA: prepilin-type N-terminal cleavage/methylation domain-containing protein, partial [Thermoanaerobaculia bacterium]|nr:prepilin-type N-terminal cleavage/methylation domain-containing protein [Thermoanaerobaculia bacterium]